MNPLDSLMWINVRDGTLANAFYGISLKHHCNKSVALLSIWFAVFGRKSIRLHNNICCFRQAAVWYIGFNSRCSGNFSFIGFWKRTFGGHTQMMIETKPLWKIEKTLLHSKLEIVHILKIDRFLCCLEFSIFESMSLFSWNCPTAHSTISIKYQ